MTVRDEVEANRSSLPAAERRVAEVVLRAPESVAFGTVALVAAHAETSGATVVRFGNRLGYEGFQGLQAAVQQELAGRLRPAAERIREKARGDIVGRTLTVESANLHATLAPLDRAGFETAITLLSARGGRVAIAPGGASHGVARQLADELAVLRPGVELVWGSPMATAAALAGLASGDVVLAVDLRRYDSALLDAVSVTTGSGASIIAVTDGVLSPLAERAEVAFAVAGEGAGPFDSHIGALALFNALLAGVATRLRTSATKRIDAIEAAWATVGALRT
jgi:DNA-binding MurR/RpiR family transcriptional regulator